MYDVWRITVTSNHMARPKKYKINEEYFNHPLSKRGAYFLGLILSDGHLDYNRGYFQYAIAAQDVSILEFIREELQSTHPIKKFRNVYLRYSITNKKLVRSIVNKYSLPHSNKSMNNIDIPTQLTNELIPHFLRGFFDGDGSIWFGGGTYRAAYTGGETMMKSIQSILEKIGVPSYFSYRYSDKNKNSCNVSINGTMNVKRFGVYLYKDATCFLTRKYKKFMECNEQAQRATMRSFALSGNENKVKQLYINGMSQAEISKNLGLIPSSVRCCVQRLRRNNQLPKQISNDDALAIAKTML